MAKPTAPKPRRSVLDLSIGGYKLKPEFKAAIKTVAARAVELDNRRRALLGQPGPSPLGVVLAASGLAPTTSTVSASNTPQSSRRTAASRQTVSGSKEGQGARQGQQRPSGTALPPALGAPRQPVNMLEIFRNPEPAEPPQQPFQDFLARWPETLSGSPARPLPDAAPPRRSAKVVRVEETGSAPFMFTPGPGTLFQTSRPRIVYRPEEPGTRPYDEDMSDQDFNAMARKAGYYTPRQGDRYVIGVGAAQGRMIPMALARRLGGYIDPETGKTMRFSGDFAGANAGLDRQGSMEMTRRRDAMNTAAIRRAIQSPGERQTWAGLRGGGDGIVDGLSPLVEATAQTAMHGTPWSDNHAAAKYQVDMDEVEHPVIRNAAKIGAAVFTPSPFGKAKVGGALAKAGKDMAGDFLIGSLGGVLTTEGDLGDRFEGALKDGALNVGMGRFADGAVRLAGRGVDALSPSLWRDLNGFDMPATRLFRTALHRDNSTLNGALLDAADDVASAPGPYVAGLKEAIEDTNAARRGPFRVIPSATPEGQFFRSPVASLDPYSTETLEAALAGDRDILEEMVRGDYLERLRREKTGDPIKKALAAMVQIPLDEHPEPPPAATPAPAPADPLPPWVGRVPIRDPHSDTRGEPKLYFYKAQDGSYFAAPQSLTGGP